MAVVTRVSEAAFSQFTIRDRSGAVLLSSDAIPALKETFIFYTDGALWSPDSEALVLAAGDSRYKETILFVHSGRTFSFLPLPNVTGGRDNPWIIPLRWIKGRRIVLSISGPYAGKANGYHYSGRATLRVTTSPPKCEKLYERVLEKHEDDS